jgi:diadenylate cyclase
LTELHMLSPDDLLENSAIVKVLGYPSGLNITEEPVSSRGYRILHKIPRLPQPVVENLVERFETLPRILDASIDELDEVEGIGEVRARAIKEGLRRLQDQVFIDRHI